MLLRTEPSPWSWRTVTIITMQMWLLFANEQKSLYTLIASHFSVLYSFCGDYVPCLAWVIRLFRYVQCVLCRMMHWAGVAKDRAVQVKGNWNVFSKRTYKYLSVWFPGWWLIAYCKIRTYRTNNSNSRLLYHVVDSPLVWSGFWWYEPESRDSGSVKRTESLNSLSLVDCGGWQAVHRGPWSQ